MSSYCSTMFFACLPILALVQQPTLPPSETVVMAAEGVEIPAAPLAVARPDLVEFNLSNGSVQSLPWKPFAADKNGEFSGPFVEGGYVRVFISSPKAKNIWLKAEGDSFVYVNGEPRVGDVYSTGYVEIPVSLKAGENTLLFRCARGRLKVVYKDVTEPILLDARDSTLPDQIVGERSKVWGAVVVRNATSGFLKDYQIIANGQASRIPMVPPMSVRKVPFLLPAGVSQVHLALRSKAGVANAIDIRLRSRKPLETHRRTFLSEVDGSVQYYAVNPAQTAKPNNALVLSLHGASVEAQGQADAYASKSWATIAAATNRRPYGYDWEDWGRIDALEVFADAKKRYAHDSHREFLVGHSMGGHGTWQVGTLYPDLFGAIAPSAGWSSSYSYARAKRLSEPDALTQILRRAGIAGDTNLMAKNLSNLGVFILHGDADDNVPVSEARGMATLLGEFHHDFQLAEIPGQNHWWDLNDENGADAVDYAPMFDFLARHAKREPGEVRQVDFITPNPEISAKAYWATVLHQTKTQELSELHLRMDPYKRRFVGTTENVSLFSVDISVLMPGTTVRAELDGDVVEVSKVEGSKVTFSRTSGHWLIGTSPGSTEKNPQRYGPLRLGLNHRFAFVYGTKGTREENVWALAKAKYDAETWWYRGNGAVDVVPDTEFGSSLKGRSIVLYGNAETNSAWPQLLGGSPVEVYRGHLLVPGTQWVGTDLATVFIRPRADDPTASVIAIAPTGDRGQWALNNLPYLQPMLGFPDVLVVGSDILSTGLKAVRGAGFFDNAWKFNPSDFARRGE